MPRNPLDLSQLDQFVMMAILRHAPNAYGVSISDEIEKRTKRGYSLGAVYASLERLEERGFITSRVGEATQERGGRRKTFFSLSASGQLALSASLRAANEMSKGLVLKGAPI